MQDADNIIHILPDYPLSSESCILSRYQTIFKKKGINSIEELLLEFPTKYEDFTLSSTKKAKPEESIILEGMVASKVTVSFLISKLSTLVFQLEVEGIKIRCTIFNRVFLKQKLTMGTVVRVQGKFYKNMVNFTVNNIIVLDEISRDIIPTYRIKDISESKYLEIMSMVYRHHKDEIKETLPNSLINKYNLPSLSETIKILHLSDDIEEIKKAQERVKYEELLRYQVSMKYLHYMRQLIHNCPVINYDENLLNDFIKSLPYKLTEDQIKVTKEILNDLKAPYAMNRLLQGEVGSGKTIVAVIAILATVSSGFQSALMCPTEILSKQHFETLKGIFSSFGYKIALLTGSTCIKEKKEIIDGLSNGSINIIVGTHALFQKDVEYKNLGVVIADEEHRFGVRQRVMIRNKGLDVNYLKMSATPIPRTLAISAYGDTDISIIKTMPINRKEVITKYVSKENKKEVIKHMTQEISNGHQIYVVTPLIEESEVLDTANATEIYENMKSFFKDEATVGLIHGKLKPSEKEEIMQKFLNKEIQILVATSVIEVGVNVINATTIVILGAERFGVATLHQLRGRVMRSDSIPYCFFITNENPSENSIERLQMVEKTTDGFTLAEYDLKHRGPGEFFGEKQSGSMNFKYASLKDDSSLLEKANEDSEKMIHSGELFNDNDFENLLKVAKHNYEMKQTQLD